MIRGILENFARLVAIVRKRRLDADFDEEIRSHIELLTEENIARGMSTDEAHRQAMLRLGGLSAARDSHRNARGFPILERFFQTSWLDFKLGLRMMLKYPGLSLAGVVGMGVAIAIGAGIFAVFQATLFPSIPVDDGDRLVGIENWDTQTRNQDYHSLHDFLTWREELKSVEEIGAFHARSSNLIKDDGAVEQVRVVEINAGGLRTAHVEPLMGRLLTDEDDKPGTPDVAIISHQLWQREFDADPAILGRTVRLGSTAHTVVGVMPPGFAFPVNDNLWIPLRPNALAFQRGAGPDLFVFGRLAAGFTRERAQAELTRVGERTAADFPQNSHVKARIVAYSALFFDDIAMAEFVAAQFLVTMLLVVVFANIAILVYARTASRSSEIAVRNALGAGRRRIVSQLFIEALVLTSGAAVFGLTLIKIAAQEARALFVGEAGAIPFWIDFSLSTETILITVAFTVLAALIAGVVPALKATGRHVERQLRQLEGGARMQLGRTWTALIIVQVAVVVAILPGVIFNAWQEYGTFEPGFPVDEFVGARLGLENDPAQSTAVFNQLQSGLIERIKAEPGVVGVTRGAIPGKEARGMIEVDGKDGRARMVRFSRVDSNFFDVFTVRMLMGQSLAQTAADGAVVVNRAFVDEILGGANPLGRRVRYVANRRAGDEIFVFAPGGVPETRDNDGWYEITGVVDNLPAKPVQAGEAAARIYHPTAADEMYTLVMIRMRQAESTRTFGARLRQMTANLDPSFQIRSVLPLDEFYRRDQLERRLSSQVLTFVSASVLLLSAAGIYALMSFAVVQRRREIGIRIALGADRRRILSSIFVRAMCQLAIGVMLGTIAAFALNSLMGSDFIGGHVRIMLPLVATLMFLVGLVAAVGPARRGLSIQPTEALKDV